ncbi:MAG TPA: hypothetical protein VLT84_10045 [Acidobacteriota bacterium]|nr:hypothetical protein [Acidobacteriota bacterium]
MPPKGSKWDTDDVEWHEGWTLYIRDGELAQKVYNAMYRSRSFRVVVDGAVVCSIPKDVPGSHETAHVNDWTSKDMDWDLSGCLVIKDKQLGERVVGAQAIKMFRIIMDQESLTNGTDGGPIGGNQVNGMCDC